MEDENVGMDEVFSLSGVSLDDKEAAFVKRLLRTSMFDTLPDFMFEVLGRDGALKFFDVFAGESIKVPTVSETARAIVDAKIYSFFKNSENNSEDPYASIAAWLKISRRDAIKTIARVKKRLGEFNPAEHERLIVEERKRRKAIRASELAKKDELKEEEHSPCQEYDVEWVRNTADQLELFGLNGDDCDEGEEEEC